MANDRTQSWQGVTLVVLSAVAFSTAGFVTRLIDTDVWTMLFWRGLFGGLFIAGYILWRHGAEAAKAFRGIGRAGLVV
ncbi:MAG TPA: EamA/RhaT family transporter, partial [Reyranella sp.]